MATPIKTYFRYRLPIPAADATDEEVIAFRRAYDAWYADRAEEQAWDRIAMAESEPGLAEAMARADALGVL